MTALLGRKLTPLQAWNEDFEERAAIVEWLCGLPRAEAERLATEYVTEERGPKPVEVPRGR